MPVSKICTTCNKGYMVQPKRKDTSFYCSRECVYVGMAGRTPWNKGELVTKRCEYCNEAFDVIPAREATARFCSKRCFNDWKRYDDDSMIGENNPLWKGDEVGYTALHDWVRSRKGTPQQCSHCGCASDRKYEWANISKEYLRDEGDWVRLCVPCHKVFDSKDKEVKVK